MASIPYKMGTERLDKIEHDEEIVLTSMPEESMSFMLNGHIHFIISSLELLDETVEEENEDQRMCHE